MKTTKLPGPIAKKLIARDAKHISPSYPRGYPFVMDHGRGSEVWDVDGNRFLDFAAGIAVTSTGHAHPMVVQAIKDQADKFIHISSDYYHKIWIELSEKINEIRPFKEEACCFMTNSGTEAVEAAIKLARYHTGRSDFISFFGGFHGRTIGAVTMTASKSLYHRGFHPLMNGVHYAPYPDPYRPILNSAPGEDYGETVVRYIEEELFGRIVSGDNVAGIIIEPVQGEGGYIVPPEKFFPALRKLCDKHGILLIADEVQAGVGRTGKWWSIENFCVEPDIFCSAKGIASGMPLGLIASRKSVMTWPRGSHGNTYGGNPISCAASLATLDLVGSEYMENAAKVGTYAIKQLKQMQKNHPTIGEVRGIGLMIGVEFVKDKKSKKPNPEVRNAVETKCYENGLLTLGCGKSVIRVSPPLCITKQEIDEGLAIFDKAISECENSI